MVFRHRESTEVLSYEYMCTTGSVGQKYPVTYVGTGHRSIDDRNNHWRAMKKSSFGGDVGGPLLIVSQKYECNAKAISLVAPPSKKAFIGRIIPELANFGPANFPVVPVPTDESLWIKGATAIARCDPVSPVSGLSNFIGELKRDGLPAIVGSSMFKSRVANYRLMGDELLNIEFAWKPFVSDIQKFCRAVKTADKVIHQYERDSGRNIRRRYDFPEIVTETTTDLGTQVPATGGLGSPLMPVSQGHLVKIDRTTVKTWFSGCFTYHLDLGDSTRAKSEKFLKEANKLLGVQITPDVLWNLTPWTWALDWVGNIGSVAENASSVVSDGLVMKWGYLMEQTTRSVSYTMSGLVSINGAVDSSTQTFSTVVSKRVEASPYGFGINYESFSDRQWSIIAALGISRGGVRISR